MKFSKRRGIAHIVVALIILIVASLFVYVAVQDYNLYTAENAFVSGTFQGYSAVPYTSIWGSGVRYIVVISGSSSALTLECNSANMGAGDIFSLTHLTIGQNVTMSEACTGIH